jgi:hypothetical protein
MLVNMQPETINTFALLGAGEALLLLGLRLDDRGRRPIELLVLDRDLLSGV